MAVGLLAFGATQLGGPDAQPRQPSTRPLPPSALAAEAVAPARPPLVDVVDAEAAPPRSLAIPAIDVEAHVETLRSDAAGGMETPDDFDAAGWYEPGPEPGEQGAAVIAGHVDSTSGPAAFYRLGELERGDLVHVRRVDGSRVSFWVEALERRPKASFPSERVFGRTTRSTLRLVTCSGGFDESSGHYLDNTIVYAVRVPRRLET